MHHKTLIGGYLLRLTREEGRTRITLQDLKNLEVLEFETWVAAWEFVDRVLQDFESESDSPPRIG